jgi:Pyruvate/2-oxoacid:ferredoxin oxidoreductase gamma subunit
MFQVRIHGRGGRGVVTAAAAAYRFVNDERQTAGHRAGVQEG